MENKKFYIAIGIIAIIIFALVVAIILSDSDKKEEKNTNTTNKNAVSSVNNTTDEEDKNADVNYTENAEAQLAAPKSGETIAVMHVKDFGDITFKFFNDKAPKAVENFLTHAKDGYYNGIKFHRVMEEFMIQGGDPTGNGTGGESIWGEGASYEHLPKLKGNKQQDNETEANGEEIDASLVPYRGALCMASTGYGRSSLGSQFFIVQANATDEMKNALSQYGYPEGLIDAYSQYGGYLSLYGMYTVFGQVVDGMDVVDKIVKVEKNLSETGELSVPVNDVIIESIEVKVQD